MLTPHSILISNHDLVKNCGGLTLSVSLVSTQSVHLSPSGRMEDKIRMIKARKTLRVTSLLIGGAGGLEGERGVGERRNKYKLSNAKVITHHFSPPDQCPANLWAVATLEKLPSSYCWTWLSTVWSILLVIHYPSYISPQTFSPF